MVLISHWKRVQDGDEASSSNQWTKQYKQKMKYLRKSKGVGREQQTKGCSWTDSQLNVPKARTPSSTFTYHS